MPGALRSAGRNGMSLAPAVAVAVVFIWLGYVIYSWVWPRILNKLI